MWEILQMGCKQFVFQPLFYFSLFQRGPLHFHFATINYIFLKYVDRPLNKSKYFTSGVDPRVRFWVLQHPLTHWDSVYLYKDFMKTEQTSPKNYLLEVLLLLKEFCSWKVHFPMFPDFISLLLVLANVWSSLFIFQVGVTYS